MLPVPTGERTLLQRAVQRWLAKLPLLCGVGMIALTGCAALNEAETAAPLSGSWHVDYIEGAGVVDRSPAHYRFGDDMRVSGNASCNLFNGTYEIVDGAIAVGSLASTRKLCPPALMEQETRFLAAMQRVHHWRSENGLLYLYDEQGTELFRGARWYDPEQ